MVRPMQDKDIPQIMEFIFETYSNKLGAMKAFIRIVDTPLSKAWVYELGNGIIGYAVGYGLSKDVFYFADIYLKTPTRVKKFVETLEADIGLTYKTWLSTAVTKDGKGLLSKLGERI